VAALALFALGRRDLAIGVARPSSSTDPDDGVGQ
jgi:hypothetical protein